MIHNIRVIPYSGAENRIKELISETKSTTIIVKKGIENGELFHEYVFTQNVFDRIKTYLLQEKDRA